MIYAETVRSLTESAARRGQVDERGICRPDSMTTNLAKYTFATGYHDAIRIVQECAGGLLVTGPGGDDWDAPEVRPVLEKYFGAAAPAAERLAMMKMIADLTVGDFGGYQSVLAVHAEGSIEAEKMQILREYDAGPAPSGPLARPARRHALDDTDPSALGTFCAVSSANRQRRLQNREARTSRPEEHAPPRPSASASCSRVVGLVLAVVVGARARVRRATSGGSDYGREHDHHHDEPDAPRPPSVGGQAVRRGVRARCRRARPTVPVKVGPPPDEAREERPEGGHGRGREAERHRHRQLHRRGVLDRQDLRLVVPAATSRHDARSSDVMPGWQQGIPGMQVGGERLLGIPPALGYGIGEHRPLASRPTRRSGSS